jgi:hypothetical protein
MINVDQPPEEIANANVKPDEPATEPAADEPSAS